MASSTSACGLRPSYCYNSHLDHLGSIIYAHYTYIIKSPPVHHNAKASERTQAQDTKAFMHPGSITHTQTLQTHHTPPSTNPALTLTTPPPRQPPPTAACCPPAAGRNLPAAGALAPPTSISAPRQPASRRRRHRAATPTRRRSLRCQPRSRAAAPPPPPQVPPHNVNYRRVHALHRSRGAPLGLCRCGTRRSATCSTGLKGEVVVDRE
eukprot:scaffold9266_cov110-Isochrysis_galbana.AAC.9